MYVTSSRPDIMFPTCMCARYQANPNEHHVSVIKRIFLYLKGTINLGIWYPKDSGFDQTTYSDADHAGCHLDRKSTSGSVQFLGDKLVCWSSKKQNYVSISTAESENVAVSGCCAQVLWMRTQLTDYGFFYDKVPIYYDSKSASAVKRIFCYLKGTINLGLWYLKDSGFDLTAYSDADHARCHLDRKSTPGSVQFLGDKLMRTQLTDYGFFYDKVPIYCNSKSVIAISCNLQNLNMLRFWLLCSSVVDAYSTNGLWLLN
nr:uncharacterized mitochondrial protein AtMg00810-like [Tanacetum cinerariifolium]